MREFTHNAANRLTLDNTDYKQWVFRYTFLELEKDFGTLGDLSSELVFEENFWASANIVAKSEGILAGVSEIEYFLVGADKNFRPRIAGDFVIEKFFMDGEKVVPGNVIMKISGGVKDLLVVERVVLNLLMRMSGVATNALRIVELVPEVLVVPTRKTLWGWLDKKACSVGGAGTHRLNLSDAIILKDTHLDFFGRDLGKVFEKIEGGGDFPRFVEIEVENGEEALRVAEFFNGRNDFVPVVMFDNVVPEEIFRAIVLIKERGFYDSCLFEASGGIGEGNVRDYATTGVDIVSMGCLTGGVAGVDMSMKIK